jgi:hypothetical protein
MIARVLPRGWIDLLRQIVLFCGAYWLYRVVRGFVDGRAAEAFDNARMLIDVERSLGLFVEPAVHAWATARAPVIDAASWMYLNSHFVITVVVLAWLYLRRNERFYFVRNMFMVAMGLALVGYPAFPTAPPRFMPEWGFTDSVAAFTGVKADSASADLLFNPFAAVPSMHVAFALMIGVTMAHLVRRRWGAPDDGLDGAGTAAESDARGRPGPWRKTARVGQHRCATGGNDRRRAQHSLSAGRCVQTGHRRGACRLADRACGGDDPADFGAGGFRDRARGLPGCRDPR